MAESGAVVREGPVLEVENVHTYYGASHVLQGISLRVAQGEVLTILGRNGMGKTTLIRSIIGFSPPRRGAVRFRGTDITRWPSYRMVAAGMALVPQGRRVFPSLSVRENLEVAAGGHGQWNLERVCGLFPRLAERAGNRANKLSGGEQQMLAIGRALMTNPILLLLDEPTEGLAPLLVREVGRVLGELRREGLSILLVEQNLPLALSVADRAHDPEPRTDRPLGHARRAGRERGREIALSWDHLRRLGMRFGTFYFFQAPPGHRHEDIIRRELEQIEWTEELGFDEAWLTEHHFIDYGLSVDPASLAAAAASRTRRIRIGLAAAILPFHHPLRLAEQMALVDIISGGRLDVGVGRGNRPAEFRGFRVPQEQSRDRFDEAVEILQRAWTEERFSYDGRFFQVPEISVIPKPVQKPHPPLYQVCVSKDGIENTALRGWPMLNSVLFGPVEQLIGNRDTYVDTLKKAGRRADEIAALLGRWGVSRQIYVADTDARALAETKDAELWYQESFKRFVIPDRIDDAHPTLQPGFRAMAQRLSQVTWEGLVKETLAFGSPDTVARHIETMRQMGVGQVMCWMNFGGLPQDKIRRSMELFAREVMPRFR